MNTSHEFFGHLDVPGGKIGYKILTVQKFPGVLDRPLLLLHGGPGGVHNYFSALSSISYKNPLVMYDQLGGGLSAMPPGQHHLWNLERFYQELECVVEQLSLRSFYLMGHSWGGVLAAEFALRNPKNLRGLILSSPLLSTPLWIRDAKRLLKQLPPVAQEMIAQHEGQGTTHSDEYKAAAREYYNRFVCRQKPWPKLLAEVSSLVNREVYQTMWGPTEFTATGNLMDYDCTQRVHELTMPVLITCGRYDEATPETLGAISKKIQNSKLVIFENSAHLPFLEETEYYIKTLSDFLLET